MKLRNAAIVGLVLGLGLFGLTSSALAKHCPSKAEHCSASVKQCKHSQKICRRKDVVSVACCSGSHKVLTSKLHQSGLDRTLQGAGPFTLFAPNDAAFWDMPKDRAATLTADKKQLAKVLEYHVLPRKVAMADFQARGAMKTVQGEDVMTNVKDGVVWIDGAQIVGDGIPARNGIVYVIDQVLAPERGK